MSGEVALAISGCQLGLRNPTPTSYNSELFQKVLDIFVDLRVERTRM